MGARISSPSSLRRLTAASQADDALARYDDDNGRISCAEARAHGIAPVERGHAVCGFMRDADGDGVVCEG